MALTVKDPYGLLSGNPAQWPEELKRAIARCCCGDSGSSSSSSTYYPFNCCGGTGTNNDFLPGNFSIKIGGTLSHDGTYGVKHWPYQTLPDWYPANAPPLPSTIVPVASTNTSFVSDLYEDFSVSGRCTTTSPFCGNAPVYNDWIFDFFYYVYYDSCAVYLGQIYRYTEHISSPGGGGCPPVDNPPTQQWQATNFFMFTDLNSPCRQLNCKPIVFKFPLKSGAFQPIFGTIVSIVPDCMFGLVPSLIYGAPGTVVEPGGSCSNGAISGASVEILL